MLLIACACLACSVGRAQLSERGISTTQPSTATPAFYSIAKPGELTMQVNVWGYVNHPGRYEIAITTDLLQLISLAGGPAPDADVDKVKVTRFLKTESGITRGEYVVDLSDLYRVSESNLILQPGDTITIDRTSWVSIRDLIGIMTSVAVIAATVATVANARRN
jgi:protein involved in polysaccharide export with SLBB domain